MTLIALPMVLSAQEWKISEYYELSSSLDKTNLSFGLKFKDSVLNANSGKFMKLFLRLPLQEENGDQVQLDRYTNKSKLVFNHGWEVDRTREDGKGGAKFHRIEIQPEIGWNRFKHFPDSTKASKTMGSFISYAAEFKFLSYKFDKNKSVFNFRLRYEFNYKEADKVGLVNGTIVNDFIVSEASAVSKWSPAVALKFGPGGKWDHVPAIYFDALGKPDTQFSANASGRFRYEYWFQFYPNVKDKPNVQLGFAPFISQRIYGDDDFEKIEIGIKLTLSSGADSKNYEFF